MTVLVVVLPVQAIPIGVLVGAAFDRSLHRRSRFWLRFAGIVIGVVLPELAAVSAPVGEQTVGVLIWAGLAWGFCFSCRLGLCSSGDGVSIRDQPTMTMRGLRGPRMSGRRRFRRSAGSHCPTQNPHRPVSAANRTGLRLHRRPTDRADRRRPTTPSPRRRSHTLDAAHGRVGCDLVLADGLSADPFAASQ